ncbi:Trehalose-phosphate phosphatase [bacterium HR30]|nr:Trehalose-phosphate phosphatase [bacterium HR30]
MTEPLQGEARRKLLATLEQAFSLFCFFDYDGTLAEIASRPELANPVQGTREVLQALVDLPRVHVAIVSGRRVDEVRRLLEVRGAYYIGVHGAELLGPTGERSTVPGLATVEPWLDHVRTRLSADVRQLQGVWLEDKQIALVCHTRLAPAAVRPQAERIVLTLYEELQRAGAPIQLLRGKCVFEFRPAGVDKGSAVVQLWQRTAAAALPLYAGDDVTDEDAFRALETSGVTIRVGCNVSPTAARYCVDTPKDLLAFLRELLKARGKRAAS